MHCVLPLGQGCQLTCKNHNGSLSRLTSVFVFISSAHASIHLEYIAQSQVFRVGLLFFFSHLSPHALPARTCDALRRKNVSQDAPVASINYFRMLFLKRDLENMSFYDNYGFCLDTYVSGCLTISID